MYGEIQCFSPLTIPSGLFSVIIACGVDVFQAICQRRTVRPVTPTLVRHTGQSSTPTIEMRFPRLAVRGSLGGADHTAALDPADR